MTPGRWTRLLGSPKPAVFLLAAAAALFACSSPTSPSPPPGGGPGPGPGPGAGGADVLVGAGDIAVCNSPGDEATARLLDDIPGTIFAAGDNAYSGGSAADFRDCYEPSWGRHKHRTRPVPGNHEYNSPGANPYFDYFGEAAGPRGEGYYTYDVGSWRVIALNSEIDARPGSPQMQWLRNELTTRPANCTIAIWHKPLFSSGPNGARGDGLHMRDVFRLLYEFNADIVINGHDHLYERFGRQDADGRPDNARGIRQFTVGTGGVAPYTSVTERPNSERILPVWGVLKLTLHATTFDYQFIPVGGSDGDSGSGACR